MSEPWLPSDHGSEKGPLQKKVARGLTWTLIDTWGSQLLGLIVFVLLARLLTPVDFGLVALASVFVAFAQLLVDQGLGDALIQRQSLTRRQIDTAFWVAVLTGALLTVGTILLAGPIATLLGEPAIEPIIQALSLTFVAVALNSIQMGLLRREMKFRSLAVRKLLAVGIGGAVGIAMAVMNYGAWALVGQQLVAAGVSVIALWTVSPWRPGFHFSRADFRQLFAFGINVVAGDLLNFLSRNVDRLLIGAFLGPTLLGFYAVAYRILDTSQVLLVNAARKLAFPVFSRLQNDRDRMRRAYSRVTRALAVIILPGYIGLALVAPEAVVFIFGAEWAESGPVAAILFLIGPVLTVQLFSGALLNAVGHPEVTFRIRLITAIVNVIGFVIAVAVFQEITAVAAAYVIRGYLLMPLIMLWLKKYAGIPISAHLGELRSPALATIVMSTAVVAVKLVLTGNVSTFVLLAAETITGVVTFLLAIIVIDRALLNEVVTLIAQSVPGGERLARRFGVNIPETPGGGKKRGRKREQPQDTNDEETRHEVAAAEAEVEEAFTPDPGLRNTSDV
ncbi:MAG TPA: lipopolysaccharide biosynthesis protein [Candidatus Limnocylindrales bacterium]|nr:lipopolysaccharide biosynthesis protein [Candidatus Limnocylindrales bacterium]